MSAPYSPPSQEVRITDIDVPFGRLLVLMLKIAVAAVPAALLLTAVWMAVWLGFSAIWGIFGGAGMR